MHQPEEPNPVECGERGSRRQAAAAAPPEHVLSPSAFCLIMFCPLPTPCSQLRRDGEPVEVQQMPHRVVLWCTVPEGAAWRVLGLCAVSCRHVSMVAVSTPHLAGCPCRRTGRSTALSAGATSLQTRLRSRSPGLRPGCGGTARWRCSRMTRWTGWSGRRRQPAGRGARWVAGR